MYICLGRHHQFHYVFLDRSYVSYLIFMRFSNAFYVLLTLSNICLFFVKKIFREKFLIFFKKGVDFLWGIMYYNQARFVGQAVKTPPSHGGNTGSIPVRTAIKVLVFPSTFLFALLHPKHQFFFNKFSFRIIASWYTLAYRAGKLIRNCSCDF